MKLTQDIPKFIPMSITFETAEEWQLFNDLINSCETSNTWHNSNEIGEMLWKIHQLIMNGLRKI